MLSCLSIICHCKTINYQTLCYVIFTTFCLFQMPNNWIPYNGKSVFAVNENVSAMILFLYSGFLRLLRTPQFSSWTIQNVCLKMYEIHFDVVIILPSIYFTAFNLSVCYQIVLANATSLLYARFGLPVRLILKISKLLDLSSKFPEKLQKFFSTLLKSPYFSIFKIMWEP